MDGLLHSVLIDYWPYFYIIFSCLVVFVVASLYKIWKSSTTFNSAEKNETNHDEAEKFIEKPTANEISAEPSQRAKANKIEEINNKKSYADFLIDRPFASSINQSKKENEATFNLRNCLRYRLRIAAALNLATNTEKKTNSSNTNNFESDLVSSLRALSLNSPSASDGSLLTITNSRVDSLYDTLLQLIDEFDATGIAEIFHLLLERRCAIPLFLPQTKKHFLSLLGHINLPGIDNICLGEDKSLSRVAVISCRPRNQSETCDILKRIFNIDSIHCHDFTTGKVTSETVLAEIGCGCILTEESGSQKIENVLVVHVIGDFRPLWSFLRRFADCFLIEDSTVESESFFSSFMNTTDLENASLGMETNKLIGCIWKPSYGEATIEAKIINKFEHFHIQGQLSGKTLPTLKSGVVVCVKEASTQSTFKNNRWMLSDFPILKADGYDSLKCVSPTEIELRITESVDNLENVKKNEFVLQKNYQQQAKHEEEIMENRLNEEKVHEEDDKIKMCREKRREDTHQVENNSLLKLFLDFLENKDSCSRVLSIRVLEKVLTKSGEQELGPLLAKIRKLTALYSDKLSNAVAETNLDLVKEKLRSVKTNLVKSALNIEHLWRELSHLYTDMEPERRSPIIKKIPQLAAQHLMDGFSLELLDGDSNMIHMEWVKEVLHQLKTLMNGKRIFVLSVMGVQSSGKSTLLNTMFGIRMRTSVGQCTRGVNMQLVPVEDRPEYDYILLLDTEGTRSPEYHGLRGSEKRDNQMATLSILLSDATIVVIPGENDAAVKDILPIVLMAYQGSKLAEDNGGRLSSRMFFVYNRIDTKQKNKLDTIIQTLGTSLHEAFSQVQKSTGNLTNLKIESPFANFNLVSYDDSSGSDVCILGNVNKQSEPPSDVPDEKYGEELIQFREHIHRRVTNVDDGVIWKSRTIEEFSGYIKNVWDCICSANFIFTFSTVLENLLFDKLDSEYKKVERKLAEVYEKSFKNVKDEMKKLIEEKNKSLSSSSMRGTDGHIQGNTNNETVDSVTFESFEKKLDEGIFQTVQHTLDDEIDKIFNNKEKWKRHFLKKWENNKNDQALNWKCNLKNVFNRLFQYEYHVEKYKKKMRKEIYQLFKSSAASTESTEWTENKKNMKFEKMFESILGEAKKEFPPKDVQNEIDRVYRDSIAIKNRKIELTSNTKIFFADFLAKLDTEKEATKNNQTYCCGIEVRATVNRITTGKLCYDDSIISEVIRSVDSKIKEYKLTDNSVVEEMHQYGKTFIVDLMQNIQKEWEKENSVPAKLDSNKEILRKHFMMVSQDVAKTQLFAATMANTLDNFINSAFEKELVQKTFEGIRNERYLTDARLMQKHMDLYLIDLLYQNEVDKVLNNISYPKEFYAEVLHKLIAKKVPNVDAEWQSFKTHLAQAIEKAVLAVDVDRERAQTFVDHLRKEFSEGYLQQSETLSSAFLIDCSGEYEDCDNGGKKEFQDACQTKLNEVIEKKISCFENKESYAEELCPKVVTYMINLNDQTALPRCDVSCHLCKNLCIEPANHDIKQQPHDAIHQPGGVAGVHFFKTHKLFSRTCSQSFEQDDTFYLGEDNYTIKYKYRDYDKVFPGWKNPKLKEELPVREYILATYNEQIAKKYNRKPADDIPASYSRNLSSIKEQLKMEIGD